jgi:hypothetical protein
LDWFNLLPRSYRTLLLVDLQLGVEVQSSNNDVAGKVNSANNVEHKRIIERNALRHLHHTQDDDQVGAIARYVSILVDDDFPLCVFAPPGNLRDKLSREELLTSEEREPS